MTIKKAISTCILLLAIIGIVSCNDSSSDSDKSHNGSEDAEKVTVITDGLNQVNQYRSDMNRGFLLKKMREKDKEQIDIHLRWIKASLKRLKDDVNDQLAVTRLIEHVNLLSKSQFQENDYDRSLALVNFLKDELISLFSDGEGVDVTCPRIKKNEGDEVAPLDPCFTPDDNVAFYKLLDQEPTPEYGFKGFSIEGDKKWQPNIDKKNNRKAGIGMSGFDKDSDQSNLDWLISEKISIKDKENPYLRFIESFAYFTSWDDVKVMVACDFTGDLANATNADVESATWQEVDEIHQTGSVTSHEIIISPKIYLERFNCEEISVGFRYQSTASKATLWRLREVWVSE